MYSSTDDRLRPTKRTVVFVAVIAQRTLKMLKT